MTTAPNSPHDIGNRIARAKVMLAVHRIRRETGLCEACGHPCPCDAANSAANTLAGYGVPVTEAPPRMPNQRRFRRDRVHLNRYSRA